MEELLQELILQLRTLTEQLQRQNEQLLALREENAAKDVQIAALMKKIEEFSTRRTAATVQHRHQRTDTETSTEEPGEKERQESRRSNRAQR